MYKMNKNNIISEDTIAAISTFSGESGLSIVRLSGEDALKVADKIFISKNKKKPSQFKTYTVHYGFIIDLQKKKIKSDLSLKKPRLIDEVLLTVMRSPKSYTREDVVEISCHGGIVAARKILDLALKSGARLAKKGEFTKRAFINGRIDLTQAEAVLDIIKAKTDTGLEMALNHLEGALSKEIKRLREDLMHILCEVEASIDFTEEGIKDIDKKSLNKRIRKIYADLKKLFDNADKGIILTEGVTAVICGKANVGKSSLMNALLKIEKVIVTHLAGTTRDAIEELLNIEGIPFKIIDTAGILKPANLIEKESIKRSKDYLKAADIVLLVLDNSRRLSQEDKDLINYIKDKKVIVVINKIDIISKLKTDEINTFLRDKDIIKISALKGKNLKKLEKALVKKAFGGRIFSDLGPMVNNFRQKELLGAACKNITDTLKSLEEGLSSEFMTIDLREAIKNLDEIAGEIVSDDVLDRIFSKFCIGK